MTGWAALAACEAVRVGAEPPAWSPPGPAPHSGEGDHSAAPPPPVDPIEVALADRCPDPTPHQVAGRSPDLHRVLLTDAEARCNDGSPPALYVAAAADPAHARDWVLSLEPGARCATWEECAVRWCGEEEYDAAKMSTRWDPETLAAGGFLDPAPPSRFSTWNRVWLRYCSSDLWVGTAADTVLTESEPPYGLQFRGADILREALSALEAGVTSDDGAVELPPLVQPGSVVFAGSSASAFGVLHAMDEVRARLGAERFLAVADSWTTHPGHGVVDAVTAAQVEVFTEDAFAVAGPAWAPRFDPDCSPDEPWRCLDVDHTLRTAVSTPRVVRADLSDPVIYPFWEAYGVAVVDYPQVVHDTLRAQAAIPGTSALGPNCLGHIVSGTDSFVTQRVRELEDGPSWSLHDVVVSHLAGVPVVAVDGPGAAGSDCR